MPGRYRRGSFTLKVSVIIPTCNRSATLVRAIQSVAEQSLTAHEIIVVDDGSSDDTQAVIKRTFPHVINLVQQNHGVSHARNRGIDIATGDWIALLDSDDQWHPQKLQLQAHALQGDPSIRLSHTEEIWIRNGKRVNAMHKHKKLGGFIYQHCLPLCAISPSSVLIEQSVFEEFGNFDESLPACEDYDLWLRLTAKLAVHFHEQPLLTKHGGHQDQLSAKHWGMDRFRLYSLAKMLSSTSLDHQQRQATRETLQQKLKVFANGARKRGRQAASDNMERRYSAYSQ